MKIKHIVRSTEFAEIFKTGERTRGKTVSLYVKRGGEEEGPAVGIAVSKKAASRAVRRNYIRRLIYAYFREHAELLEKGVKVVVRAAGDLNGSGKQALSRVIREELGSLTKKAGIRA